MDSQKPVLLKDIAAKANVSRMTVSLALREDASIPPATRTRIRGIADQLGYKANPRVARAMAEIARTRHGRHSDRLIFLTTDQSADGWRNYSHELQCYQGALERARTYGYTLEAVWALDPKPRGRKLSRMLWAQGIEGVLLAPLGPGAWTGRGWKLDLDWNRFSVVELDETLDAPLFHRARHDHFSAMLLLLESMENLGYRRIGLALERQIDIRTRHRWYSAWLLWRNMRGFGQALEPFFYDKLEADPFRKWLEASRPDSIAGATEQLYGAMNGLGLRIPAQLGYCVLDRPFNYDRISLSGIHQNAAMIGEAGIDMLVGLVNRGERGVPKVPSQRICQGAWVKGRTTKKVGRPSTAMPLLQTMFPCTAV